MEFKTLEIRLEEFGLKGTEIGSLIMKYDNMNGVIKKEEEPEIILNIIKLISDSSIDFTKRLLITRRLLASLTDDLLFL